jgi:hypothetical protein
MAFFSKLLSLGPRIVNCNGTLAAATGWRCRMLTMGMFIRRVVINAQEEVVHIRSRYLWLFARTKTIPFRDIQAVTYGYEDWSLGADLSFAHNSLDVFTVGLRLRNDRELSLFRFFGTGEFTNEGDFYPDWMYWPDYVLDFSGTQQTDSRLFVDLLGKMIGVSVEPSRN